MKKLLILAFVLLSLALGVSYTRGSGDACIYGTAVYDTGRKSDGEVSITTSWNSEKAYTENGKYRLCLGNNPEKKITVYIKGKKYTELYVDGNTELNIVITKKFWKYW